MQSVYGCLNARLFEVLFFVSSRRRHTRLVSDWSSDVCSSDLTGVLNRHHTTATRIKTSSPSQTKDERNREAFSAKRATSTPTPDMITSIAAKRAQS